MQALQEISEHCPHCDAPITLLLDLSAGDGQQFYIEDCEVCCQPIGVRIHGVEPLRISLEREP